MNLPDRITKRIAKRENGCWEWQGFINDGGYGTTYDSVWRRSRVAHRVVYEMVRGPVPQGLTLDHLCSNRRCVNPDHLEAVTMGENVLRANSITGINSRKTHCPKGHPYDTENTYPMRNKGRTYRGCRTCRRDRLTAMKKPRLQKTHCPVGHSYDDENTYTDRKGKRHCRMCHMAREQERRGRL